MSIGTIHFVYQRKEPLYVELYHYFKEEIVSGRIKAHEKIPSIRKLSKELEISRTTVENSYQQLLTEGYIYSVSQKGYFVSEIPFSDEGNKVVENKMGKGRNLSKENSLKTVDPNSFPFARWKKIVGTVLLERGEDLLSYGTYQGEFELREEIAKYVYRSRGAICETDQIIVGAGIQQLLYILCAVLKRMEYNSLSYEHPGFADAYQVFQEQGFCTIPIPVEQNGISISQLEESGSRVCYVSPSHQYPTGHTMTIPQRTKLLHWAEKYNNLIIEDDYDSELRYIGRPIPSLQGLDQGKRVIYLGSFSTVLIPSIRISFMILPHTIKEEYEQIQKIYNQSASKVDQYALAKFMREGHFDRHLRKLRKIYTRKKEELLKGIVRYMGDQITVYGAESGLHVLLELKTSLTMEDIIEVAERTGVMVKPISTDRQRKNPMILLAYGGIPLEDIYDILQQLQKVWFL